MYVAVYQKQEYRYDPVGLLKTIYKQLMIGHTILIQFYECIRLVYGYRSNSTSGRTLNWSDTEHSLIATVMEATEYQNLELLIPQLVHT